MGLIASAIEENKTNVFDKATLFAENHNFTITKIEEVKGNYGMQWRLEVSNVTKDNEEGVLFFSLNSDKRNRIFRSIMKGMQDSGKPAENAALFGVVTKKAKNQFEEDQVAYFLREWKESYDKKED